MPSTLGRKSAGSLWFGPKLYRPPDLPDLIDSVDHALQGLIAEPQKRRGRPGKDRLSGDARADAAWRPFQARKQRFPSFPFHRRSRDGAVENGGIFKDLCACNGRLRGDATLLLKG
jgi:hypothetical protein